MIKNQKFRQLFILSLLVLSSVAASAQDWHFSQFYASPLTLNPAMTGFYNGGCRATGLFRDQWGGIYSTYQASYEHRFHNVIKGQKFDAGLVLFQDDQGSLGQFSNMKADLSIAYTMDLSESHALTVALQPGFGQKSATIPTGDNVVTGEVFSDDLSYYNGSNTETYANEGRINQFDFSAGLLWSGQMNEKMSLYAGAGLFHLAGASNDFIDNTTGDDPEELGMKMIFHGGGRMEMSEKISMIPNFIYIGQSGAQEINLGSTFEYGMPEESPLKYASAGFYVSTDDAIIMLLGMGYKAFNLGLSYDITYTDLSASQSKNALEFSLSYICPIKEVKIIRAKPCPRF